MKGNCADSTWAAWSNSRAYGIELGDAPTSPERNGAGRYVAGDADQGEAPTLPAKPVLAGCQDDTAAGAVARHNGPVEWAGWRAATGRARFIRVLGIWSRSGQRPTGTMKTGLLT